MKPVLCVLFTIYGSLQALTISRVLTVKEMMLFSAVSSLCTLLGYALGSFILCTLYIYTPFELTSIALMFVLLYLLQIKSKPLQSSKPLCIMQLAFSHIGTGILSAFQNFPAWFCFFISFFIEFEFLKHHHLFPEWIKQRRCTLFLVIMMLLILFVQNKT